jgi:hypothetical protein
MLANFTIPNRHIKALQLFSRFLSKLNEFIPFAESQKCTDKLMSASSLSYHYEIQ